MRITNKLNSYNSVYNMQAGMSQFYKINNQVSSGKVISNSYENANTYIDNARLEYERETLTQVENAAKLAGELNKNTDKAMRDLVKLIQDFKIKMTQAVNGNQTQTSREAIAKELMRIKEEIVNIANTSVNGQYLFSGSLSNTKPFDSAGNYSGNAEYLQIVTGDNTRNTYNVPGYDLFFKPDNDFKKQITTNVSFTDNRYDLINNPNKTRYLTGDDKISSLIGLGYVRNFNPPQNLDPETDFETTPLNFPATALYVQGTRPDGTSFKSAVLMQPGDNVQNMMDKIGALYGNTATNKVVDISINQSGQIQITDLREGNNSLDFHAVAYTPQFQDRTELKQATEAYFVANPGATMSDFTNEVLTAAMGNPANPDITKLQANTPVTLTINGVNYNINLTRTDFIHSNMTDTDRNATNGADYDNVYFERDGNKVQGNISQIIKETGAYATDATKLSAIANGNIANTTLNLNVTSKSGTNYEVTINFANSTVSYNNNANPPQLITFPIMHTSTVTGNSGVVTPAADVSYKQINDIIGLFASDQMPVANINQTPAGSNQIAAADYAAYQTALQNAKSTVDVSMDYKGRITVTDKLAIGTSIRVAMSDSQSGTFPRPPLTDTANVAQGPAMSFSANNALIIDEPHVDLVKDLDAMINAVLKGNARADSTSDDPRNTGMQGALERLDHLGEHLRKQTTINGANATAIQQTTDRTALLKLNVQSVKSEIMDVDIMEALSALMQYQVSYQASMKASTTLAQLSLLNYM